MGRLTHTVSGDIASLRTPSRVPIESLKFHFLPKQASGTPSPENPIPIEGWTGFVGGRSRKAVGHIIGYSAQGCDYDDTRSLSGNYGNSINTTEYNETGTVVITQTSCGKPSNPMSYENGYVTPVFDNLVDGRYYDVSFRVNNIVSNPLNVTLSNIIITNPAGSASYRPEVIDDLVIFRNFKYTLANGRPKKQIYEVRYCGMSFTLSEFMVTPANMNDGVFERYEGEQIPITFPSSSKNLYDINTYPLKSGRWIHGGNGGISSTNNYKATIDFVPAELIAGRTITLNKRPGGSNLGFAFYTEESEASFISGVRNNGGEAGTPWTITVPENAKYMRFTVPDDATDIQIELGTESTSFVPYSSDNTFYGGYIDPVAGEIVAEYALKILNGTEANWSASGDDWNTDSTGFCVPISEFSQVSNSNYILSNLLIKSDHYSLNKGQFFISSSSWANFRIRMTESMTLAELKSFLAQNNMIIAYPLTTPIHIPIPAEDMKAFLDHNNFWSDANDVTEVTYPVTESRDILATRKRIMSQTWDMIPLKYQPVEYISAKNSNPYIDMGIQFTSELEAEVHYYNDKGEAFLFGARKSASNSPYCNFNVESPSSSSAGRSRFDYGNRKATATSGLPFAGYHDGEYIFKFHNRAATMEKVSTGEVVTKEYNDVVRTDYPNYNMYLFSVNTNGTPSLNTGTGELRVYSAKFWLGGQLVRDYVPCVRKSDNKPGMYDRVSKTFFINVGSDEFVIPT